MDHFALNWHLAGTLGLNVAIWAGILSLVF